MTNVIPAPSQLSRLAVPGERFGWIFQDRNLFRRRFLEPPPTPGMVSPMLAQRVAMNRDRMAKRILLSLGGGVGVAFVLSCCGGLASAGSDAGGAFVTLLAGGAFLLGVGGAFLSWYAYYNAKAALDREQQAVLRAYHQEMAAWEGRRADFDRRQRAAVDAMFEWGAATPSQGTRRVDIIGGSSWGWEALLTVFGGSLLSTRGALTLVDFTGEALCGELLTLATEVGKRTRVTTLPSQLETLDLTAGLQTRELVASLVEAMYGDSQGGNRAARSEDTMRLTELCEALGDNITIARIIAGLRVLTDRSGEPVLTPVECTRILDLLPDEARRQAHSHFRRIEGFLSPLASMGTAAVATEPADLTCLVADRDGNDAQRELLRDLIVQWLTRQVSREAAGVSSIVLMGADDVHHTHIERLSSLCERRGIRLVLMFAHLRRESLQTLGGGEVCFMRLGNHQEAQQAADFIGRQHKFVLSQLTRTLGGNETHSVADTEGYGYSESRSDSYTSGRDYSSTRGFTTSHSRNWSQTLTTAQGTNWSDAESAQRVYEYAVEPRVLQDLPDYALLLVKGEGRGSVVQAVECDPAISTLPRLTMQPLPATPLPRPEEAWIPVSGSPTQVTISQPAPLAATHPNTGQLAPGALTGWGGGPGSTGQYVPQQMPQPHYPAPTMPQYPAAPPTPPHGYPPQGQPPPGYQQPYPPQQGGGWGQQP